MSGRGQTAIDLIDLPSSLSRVRFTHQGSSNFGVYVYYRDDRDLLVNEIGNYNGTTLISADEPIAFDISADGPWTPHIEALGETSKSSFRGIGDDVCDIFYPP